MSARRRRLSGRTRRVRWIIAATVVALAGATLAVYLARHDRAGSVYHPNARFVPESTPTSLPKHPGAQFSWPIYGYTKEHTRFFPAPESVRPPLRQLWEHNDRSLLEFPPVIYGGRLFQLADNGELIAINKRTGEVVWSRSLGTLSASTPAVTDKALYATVLNPGSAGGRGRIFAVNRLDGDTLWSRALPSPSESSPLVDHGRVFFGSQNGTVYALNDSNGDVIWTYHAAGAVKASPTLSAGVLYFGDYSGQVQAISEQTGQRIWRSGSGGTLLGSGTFYSTCAVYYGRVFLGNTDGRIYAYDASTGKLDWAVQTGAYVYASPAVTNAPGLGPTIYVGSYDGTFRAVDARSGHVSWSFDAHGRISGSATIVGKIVYFADLGKKRTYGLGISTGRVVFEKGTGAFDPVISDGRNIYLTGETGIYGLAPR